MTATSGGLRHGDSTAAYVTVLSTDGYLDGVLALHQSLRLCRSRYPLYVVVTSKATSSTRETLTRAGIRQIEATSIPLPEEIRVANAASDFHRHWSDVFDKLLVFSLCQFRKVVYLDSDVLVIRNLDHLFAKPHMSGVIADRYPGRPITGDLNAGLIVIEPEADLTDRLIRSLPVAFEDEKQWRSAAGRPVSMGVQSVINMFWSEWTTQEELQLDPKYNVLATHLDYYLQRLGYTWRGPDGIHVLHFIGAVKPWMTTGGDFWRLVARLVVRRRIWELVAVVAFKAVLGSARLRLRMRSANGSILARTGER